MSPAGGIHAIVIIIMTTASYITIQFWETLFEDDSLADHCIVHDLSKDTLLPHYDL